MSERLREARRDPGGGAHHLRGGRPRSPAQMERSVKGLVDGRYQWVIFTSTNAVRRRCGRSSASSAWTPAPSPA